MVLLLLLRVGRRRKEMHCKKVTEEFFSNCLKQRNVTFGMVFSLVVSNVRFLLE